MTEYNHGIIVGVDTHKDEHVAVAINQLGIRLGEFHLTTTTQGYAALERWAMNMDEVIAFGVEGTGSYGAGLARYLIGQSHTVIEVNRPDRSTRRRQGKSDPIDAEMAARAILSGVARDLPKSADDKVEMLRMLKTTKDSAIKARTQAINQIKALIVTAPAELRESLPDLKIDKLVDLCAGFRPGPMTTPTATAKLVLRSLARRHKQLSQEIEEIKAELANLTEEIAPALLDECGVGPDTAATLLITTGDNPERLKSEAAFAALCGVNPVPASSGKTNRHRLNRGGDRSANCALYRIVIVRLRHDDCTKEYMERRISEGMTKSEVIRCLKRYVAREIFPILKKPDQADLIRAA